MKVFPSSFQFFAQTGDCTSLEASSWFNYTDLVKNATLERLELRVKSEALVHCLKLTVYEMNDNGPVRIEGLQAFYRQLLTTNEEILAEIHEGFPLLSPICPASTGTISSNSHGSSSSTTTGSGDNGPSSSLSPPCAARSPDQLYFYQSSLMSCQCDPLCPHFGDCCDDYAVSHLQITPAHYGTKPGHFETSNQSLPQKLGSE